LRKQQNIIVEPILPLLGAAKLMVSLFVCIASPLGYTFARVPGSRVFDSASVQFKGC
jgi:hypothetical protein